MTESERDRTRTLNDKHDSRCIACLSAVYCLWVDDEPPPPGCPEGCDADISKCGHVQNRMVMIYASHKLLGNPLTEASQQLLDRLGAATAERMFEKIDREQNAPPFWQENKNANA